MPTHQKYTELLQWHKAIEHFDYNPAVWHTDERGLDTDWHGFFGGVLPDTFSMAVFVIQEVSAQHPLRGVRLSLGLRRFLQNDKRQFFFPPARARFYLIGIRLYE